MNKRIYLASPHLSGNEIIYVKEAFDTNWIAPLGKNVDMLEKEISEYVEMKYAVALVSGTSAIHLALKWYGVKENDYVFCSSLTFSGSCNSIMYENGTPVFIDCEYDSWNMCPKALEEAFVWATKQNKLPKAVIIVNLYGQMADYDVLQAICNKYNTPIIEDAAESLGATYKNKKSGTLGDISILSFNGNGIISTSDGFSIYFDNKEAIETFALMLFVALMMAISYKEAMRVL